MLTLTLTAAFMLAARTVPAQDATGTTGAGQPAPLIVLWRHADHRTFPGQSRDGTIVNFIRNSGSSYGLDADQIVYLKQQGVSGTVINTMLSQPRQMETDPPAAAPATSTATATVNIFTPPAPTGCYVDPIYVTSSSVYVIPDTQTYWYNAHTYQPYYGGRSYLGYRPYSYGSHYSFGANFNGSRWSGGSYRGGWHRWTGRPNGIRPCWSHGRLE